MQGAAKGGHPMQTTPCGLAKQGNAADCPENSLVQAKNWETQASMIRDEKPPVNVVYFALFFLAIWSMSLWLCFSWDAPLFFFAHATGQALLETGVLLLLSMCFRRWLLQLLIGASFALLLLHFTDFTLLRLMDDSISYLFRYFFGAGPEHLRVAFQALNFSKTMLGILSVAAIGVPFLGIALYWLTARVSAWRIGIGKLCVGLIALSCALWTLDVFFLPPMNALAFQHLQKGLPLGQTLVAPEPRVLTLEKRLQGPREEHSVQQLLAEKSFQAPSLPNVYLFVIETLRKDFITLETAPHLVQFAQENVSFEESFANANCTHLSWVSIFHSAIPYHWTAMQSAWKKGSVPLQILKRCGYKIHLYSAADLTLFHMDELLFGRTKELLDHTYGFEGDAIEPWQRDALCLQAFGSTLKNSDSRSGNVFIFFLDSTHSEYSVPKDFPLKFLPAPERIDYLTLTKDNIEPIKNRYRNAINYVDSLFGQFVQLLRTDGLYDEAVIALTGDHGEEFFEEGALFHGTHLNRYQTSVPLYYKFPGVRMEQMARSTTHLDLFPTLLHYLTGQSDFETLMDGESAFLKQRRWPYRIAVLHAGAGTPNEFAIESIEEAKAGVRVRSVELLYKTKELEILEERGKWDPAMLKGVLEKH